MANKAKRENSYFSATQNPKTNEWILKSKTQPFYKKVTDIKKLRLENELAIVTHKNGRMSILDDSLQPLKRADHVLYAYMRGGLYHTFTEKVNSSLSFDVEHKTHILPQHVIVNRISLENSETYDQFVTDLIAKQPSGSYQLCSTDPHFTIYQNSETNEFILKSKKDKDFSNSVINLKKAEIVNGYAIVTHQNGDYSILDKKLKPLPNASYVTSAIINGDNYLTNEPASNGKLINHTNQLPHIKKERNLKMALTISVLTALSSLAVLYVSGAQKNTKQTTPTIKKQITPER